MTQSTPSTAGSVPTVAQHFEGSVTAGYLRPARIVAAIIACGILFLVVGRWFIPGPQVDGTQALAFGPAGSLSAEGATLLAMAAAVGLGWLITWPDAPHTGTFCACAGLLALAVHWGGLNLLLVDRYSNLPAVYADLSMQCFFWIIFIALAEGISYGLYRFSTRRWPLVLGLPWPIGDSLPDGSARYPLFSTPVYPVRENTPNSRLRAVLDQLTGLFASMVVASIGLALLMKSANPGQVIFACFVAFFLSGVTVGLFLPKTAALVLWFSVPLTAAIGYLLAGHGVPALPGQVPEFTRGGIAIFWGRAEPIFYIGAGLPGMIAGFYAALRGNFRQKMEAEAAERNVAPGRTR